MPLTRDIHNADINDFGVGLDIERLLQVHRLSHFCVYPSRDGKTLFSMTVPHGAPPLCVEANRSQVTAAAHEVNAAARIMARRSGNLIDPAIERDWILQPDIRHTLCRYDPGTRLISITFGFDDRLPLPIAMSLPDYVALTERCDIKCGLHRTTWR